MRKAALLAGSHLLCLLAGGYFLNAATGPQENRDAGMAATKRGERTTRDPLSERGEALAAEMLAASKAPLFDGVEADKAAGRFSGKGEGERRVRELATAGAEPSAEFAGALLAWLREDPSAALGFLRTKGMDRTFDEVVLRILGEINLSEHLKLAQDEAKTPKGKRVAEILSKKLAELSTADAADFFLKSGLLKDEGLLGAILRGWPTENVSTLLELALATDDLRLVQTYLRGGGNPRKSSSLLVLMESRNELPPQFTEFLEQSGELRGHLYRYADPSVPLDERIAQMKNLAWLKDATPEALREGALKQISTVDINELMKTGPDYRYAFRHGAMTADEILAAVRETFPELAAASDYETRVRVFNELASEDAQAAFALISHLPEEQRNLAVIHQSRWTFRDTGPEAFYEMINLAPGPDSEEAAPQREEAWTVYGGSAYREYGDYYVDWVRELPAGVNRDVARATLATVLRQRNQNDLAAEFEKP